MTVRRHAARLETVSVTVPLEAAPAYEAALQSVCETVGLFEVDANDDIWRVEGVKDAGADEDTLETHLALAAAATGVTAVLERVETPAEGWLARTYDAFPEQRIGRRFLIRGTHLAETARGPRLTLTLDAGLAFGSGEHASTRGCLRAVERIAHRHPRRIVDIGTGSGILAMGAARLLHQRVLATDIEPWSVRVAAQNARLNGLRALVATRLASGWRNRAVRAGAPYDLVFANILARPLCAMARDLASHLAPGGTAILSGLLASQSRQVLAAHRRHGLRLERRIDDCGWATLVLRGPPRLMMG